MSFPQTYLFRRGDVFEDKSVDSARVFGLAEQQRLQHIQLVDIQHRQRNVVVVCAQLYGPHIADDGTQSLQYVLLGLVHRNET